MNRRQRRADAKRPARPQQEASRAEAADLLALASAHHGRRDLAMALKLYGRLLAVQPGHAVALERIAMIYGAQGQLLKASEQFAELAQVAPQSLLDFAKVLETLKHLVPALAEALAAPRTASLDALTAIPPQAGAGSIAGDPYFRVVLQSTTVRDAALERWLTAQRANLLRFVQALAQEVASIDDALLAFCGALAQQCFINEYVFSVATDEDAQVARLAAAIDDHLRSGDAIDPMQVAVLAMYRPLGTLADAPALARRSFPAEVEAVITQQLREPRAEQELRATIRPLTGINDGITALVRQQYEESPYPRWVLLPQPPDPLMVIDDHLRYQFPTSPFRPTGARDSIDVLVAGCGTGRHALEIAQSFRGARVLGVDLSLSSLSHAKRKTPPALADRVEFAQGDILKLGSLGRSFDFVNVSGVLHHMEDALGGWRALIKLLKPDGVMQIGLYSAHARKEIVATRRMIATLGLPATPDGIRRCRDTLRDGAEPFKFMTLRDFYSTSECRDLMFNVQERQFTIPEIKAFLADNGVRFIGFEFTPQSAHMYFRDVFAKAGWSTSSLDDWDRYERANPDTFAGMYKFWIQKIEGAATS